CTRCDPAVPLLLKNKQLILQHNGAHILFDPKVPRADQPCGLCLRPFPLCQFFLSRGSGTDSTRQIDWKRSTCLRPLTFSMAAAQKWSETSPCTNYLVPCPLQCGHGIWTYNLEAHLRSVRHGLQTLANINMGYIMAPRELELMRTVFDGRQNYPRPRPLKGKKKTALVESAAHSSTL
ncbi:hypothetical protein C8R43DRAFT_819735, partial [Mycena crocata]